MGLKQTLQARLPKADLNRLVKSFDIVGDIAVIIIPDSLRKYEASIGEAILDTHRNVRTVLRRDGTYSGDYRILPLAHICGEKKTETTCQEFGVRLKLDLAQVYYSVRLGTERKRVADLVSPEEHVLVMFSGIAPYPLMIFKYAQAQSITGIEKNGVAHAYALSNVKLNKADTITLLHGDAKEILKNQNKRFDRIIMPLPHGSAQFLEVALDVLELPGTLHYYSFQADGQFEQAVAAIEEYVQASSRRLSSAEIFVCGHNSPKQYRICVDAVID